MILDRFRIDGKVAVVTGAGRGIGAATAVALAQAGADVVVSARTEEQLQKVAADIEAAGRRALVVPADLNDLDAAAGLAERAAAELGRLDIVVNNVGGSMPAAFMDTSPRDLKNAFHFNVAIAHALNRAAVPHLLETGDGAIVNISSVMGRVAGRGFLAYGSGKASFAHYTRLAALDLAPKIRVNAVAVGSVATSALDIVMTNDELRTQMEDNTPLRRIGHPDDVASAVLYLSSPAGAYVTGSILQVDGGIDTPNLDLGLEDL
ncbi:SDR family oxidoreductase [Actinomadura barringtoniae]|uniref:SDR family oxidoreductase n=1 Tax=Actinomadura barringtoniae TaxID=1427535 RepID=A0A939PMI1_9ACTN|nr:SDR family oxidoreductase [Actinomadura barringtoniae]MBO2451291.1 SDR family oxidoreductase [Actinomadura barringtoniae]